MQAHPVSGFNSRYDRPGFFDNSGYFVAESHRQRANRRFSVAIMDIGMTDPRGANANEDVAIPDFWDGDFLHLQGLIDFDKPDCFHWITTFVYDD
jgi:hypothetical protein